MSTYRYSGAYILNLDTLVIEDVGVTVLITDNTGDTTFDSGAASDSDTDQQVEIIGSSVDGVYLDESTAGEVQINTATGTATGQFGQFVSGGTTYWFFVPNEEAGTLSDGQTINGFTTSTTGFDYSAVEGEGSDTILIDSASAGVELTGGDGNDSLDGSNSADTLLGGAGNDTLRGRSGADSIVGGQGEDFIRGNAGNDTILGDGQESVRLGFRWSEVPDPDDLGLIDDEDVLASSDATNVVEQDTGGILVSIDYDEINAGARDLTFQNVTNVVDGITGDDAGVSANSSGQIFGNRVDGTETSTSITTINFSSSSPSFVGEVENVQFRINDLDQNNPPTGFQDQVVIRAFDADDNRIAVTLTSGAGATSGPTLSDGGDGFIDTATANTNGLSNADAEGSVLVEVDGPVARIEIEYLNLGTSNQGATITDIFFDAAPAEGGNDNINAGGGADSVLGQFGDDTIRGGGGADTIDGGVGNDTIDGDGGNDSIIGGEGDDSLFGDNGADTIDGGAGNDTLSGGAGLDELTGGDGFDTFIVDGTADTITDFNTATGQVLNDGDQTNNDFVDLSAFYNETTLATYNADNGTSFTQAIQALRDDAADGVLNAAGNVALTGVDPDELFFDNTNVVCFTPGAKVLTPTGPLPVERLETGHPVLTRDHGIQHVEWIGRRELTAEDFERHPRLAPIRIRRGALGPDMPSRDLVVSPQHRVMLGGARAATFFGQAEVLVPAVGLIDEKTVTREPQCGRLTYIHFMCSRHELVRVDNLWTESLFVGEMAREAMSDEAREEIELIFGELPVLRPARQFVTRNETRLLRRA